VPDHATKTTSHTTRMNMDMKGPSQVAAA
jgi:hypothetical protein